MNNQEEKRKEKKERPATHILIYCAVGAVCLLLALIPPYVIEDLLHVPPREVLTPISPPEETEEESEEETEQETINAPGLLPTLAPLERETEDEAGTEDKDGVGTEVVKAHDEETHPAGEISDTETLPDLMETTTSEAPETTTPAENETITPAETTATPAETTNSVAEMTTDVVAETPQDVLESSSTVAVESETTIPATAAATEGVPETTILETTPAPTETPTEAPTETTTGVMETSLEPATEDLSGPETEGATEENSLDEKKNEENSAPPLYNGEENGVEYPQEHRTYVREDAEIPVASKKEREVRIEAHVENGKAVLGRTRAILLSVQEAMDSENVDTAPTILPLGSREAIPAMEEYTEIAGAEEISSVRTAVQEFILAKRPDLQISESLTHAATAYANGDGATAAETVVRFGGSTWADAHIEEFGAREYTVDASKPALEEATTKILELFGTGFQENTTLVAFGVGVRVEKDENGVYSLLVKVIFTT